MRRRTPLAFAVLACLIAVPAAAASATVPKSVRKARQSLTGYVRVRGNRPGGEILAARSAINTAPPLIAGAPNVGSKLTATRGTWLGTSLTYSYQWQRCSSAGAACSAIGGATSSTYDAGTTDATKTLRVAVTARNKWGRAT